MIFTTLPACNHSCTNQ